MKISPPAFPTYLADNMAHGMTMRDYFAAAAMQAFITNDNLLREASHVYENGSEISIAILSYEQADAMMEARNL